MLAAIEGKIHAQQARAKTAESAFTTIATGFANLMEADDVSDIQAFSDQIVEPINIANKAFSGIDLSIPEGAKLLEGIRGGDSIYSQKLEEAVTARAIKDNVPLDNVQGMEKIRKGILDELIDELSTAIQTKAKGMRDPGLAKEVKKVVTAMATAKTKAEELADVMQDVGNMQIGILKKVMEREQDKMAAVLDKADAGFQKAAVMFQAAVTEFALFRGGITPAEIQGVEADVKTAKAGLDQAEKSVAELLTGKVDPNTGETTFEKTDKAKAQIKKAGDDAAEGERATAEAKKSRQQDLEIRDRQQRVIVAKNVLENKQSLLKRVKSAAPAAPAAAVEEGDAARPIKPMSDFLRSLNMDEEAWNKWLESTAPPVPRQQPPTPQSLDPPPLSSATTPEVHDIAVSTDKAASSLNGLFRLASSDSSISTHDHTIEDILRNILAELKQEDIDRKRETSKDFFGPSQRLNPATLFEGGINKRREESRERMSTELVGANTIIENVGDIIAGAAASTGRAIGRKSSGLQDDGWNIRPIPDDDADKSSGATNFFDRIIGGIGGLFGIGTSNLPGSDPVPPSTPPDPGPSDGPPQQHDDRIEGIHQVNTSDITGGLTSLQRVQAGEARNIEEFTNAATSIGSIESHDRSVEGEVKRSANILGGILQVSKGLLRIVTREGSTGFFKSKEKRLGKRTLKRGRRRRGAEDGQSLGDLLELDDADKKRKSSLQELGELDDADKKRKSSLQELEELGLEFPDTDIKSKPGSSKAKQLDFGSSEAIDPYQNLIHHIPIPLPPDAAAGVQEAHSKLPPLPEAAYQSPRPSRNPDPFATFQSLALNQEQEALIPPIPPIGDGWQERGGDDEANQIMPSKPAPKPPVPPVSAESTLEKRIQDRTQKARKELEKKRAEQKQKIQNDKGLESEYFEQGDSMFGTRKKGWFETLVRMFGSGFDDAAADVLFEPEYGSAGERFRPVRSQEDIDAGRYRGNPAPRSYEPPTVMEGVAGSRLFMESLPLREFRDSSLYEPRQPTRSRKEDAEFRKKSRKKTQDMMDSSIPIGGSNVTMKDVMASTEEARKQAAVKRQEITVEDMAEEERKSKERMKELDKLPIQTPLRRESSSAIANSLKLAKHLNLPLNLSPGRGRESEAGPRNVHRQEWLEETGWLPIIGNRKKLPDSESDTQRKERNKEWIKKIMALQKWRAENPQAASPSDVSELPRSKFEPPARWHGPERKPFESKVTEDTLKASETNRLKREMELQDNRTKRKADVAKSGRHDPVLFNTHSAAVAKNITNIRKVGDRADANNAPWRSPSIQALLDRADREQEELGDEGDNYRGVDKEGTQEWFFNPNKDKYFSSVRKGKRSQEEDTFKTFKHSQGLSKKGQETLREATRALHPKQRGVVPLGRR